MLYSRVFGGNVINSAHEFYFYKLLLLAARKNFKKYPHSQLDFRGEAYDYLSISHYRKDTFGGGRMTIKTLQKKYQDLIGTSTHLSASDVRQLNAMYRCNGEFDHDRWFYLPIIKFNC